MLQNAYLLAKIGADTAENEQHFAKNLRKTDNYPTSTARPWRRARLGLHAGRAAQILATAKNSLPNAGRVWRARVL